MKSVKLTTLCFLAAMSGAGLWAQDAPSKTVVNELLKHWQASKDLSLAVAEAMPEAKYSFKATDAEMTFGGQMNHIAAGAMNYCSRAMKAKNPMEKPADDSKAVAVKNLTAAYDFCIDGLKESTDASLQKPITMKTGEVSPFELFWGGFTHSAHHRGQAEVYLRLAGVVPPDYKF